MKIHDYDICLSSDRLTIFTESGQTDFSLADFFDFVVPAFQAWNEPESQTLFFEGPTEGRVFYSRDGGEWREYPCRADSMTWDEFIIHHSGDFTEMVEQYYIISK